MLIESPFLNDCFARLKDDDSGFGEESFWSLIADKGTPIVEEYPPDQGQVLVSFVAKGAPSIKTLAVIGGIIVDTKCWWDDIPVVSEMFDLGVKENANCR